MSTLCKVARIPCFAQPVRCQDKVSLARKVKQYQNLSQRMAPLLELA
jgi:hypothetical protein